MNDTEREAYTFLLPILNSIPPAQSRPTITLTYASSLDGLISGPNGRQLALSGRESFIMTHALRALHDGILVGIGTVLNDNPSLTVRLVEYLSNGDKISDIVNYKHPRPILLDTRLRTPVECTLMARNPIIVTDTQNLINNRQRVVELESGGAVMLPCPVIDGRLDLPSVLDVLKNTYGIKSIMIEGGASVIRTMLVHHPHVVDTAIVTIAPLYVGNGVHVMGLDRTGSSDELLMPKLEDVIYRQFGKDIVLAARIQRT
ncbi:hypothetical protein SmJEL517_g02814 [Synchytrium microbalum]|uniref:2,5-diamino-6-ribosylamino-4(3H)-pyrimidinone 5'-phosphate reductase n=1 Tax=Synchytrium microbalum TaxID=1806994 RepID=A0A507C995_9FUNG|nr:uncharacterized protein SmJEL517_g02814 [Synchytrium microbalum]TPX34566.1 hypothetical protein SmJEL517_g02814 [Synchytrium microbalum]